ncbi:unnamed protein product [Cercopithifilaria johnstoni]|uniref:Uncharacterized protein n=1 Tax=Cercopithifilaria johnstoni TaxID=2874296 RepID=A0A8J2LZN3_9BILA|nr:unnamed protein product [Cercopithifilaria johnstoni]
MADQVNDKNEEDNAELRDRKSVDNSELQQFTSGFNIIQVNEAINSQGNRNKFQQGNNFYSQQPFIVPVCKIPDKTEIRQQIPFEFENYANQVLGEKLIQSFVGANNTEDKIDFVLPQVTGSNLNDQQTMSNEIINISDPVKNFLPELKNEKHTKFGILHDDESSGRNGTEINNEMMNKNSENRNFEHQQLEKCGATSNIFNTDNIEQQNPTGELVPKTNRNVVPENKQDFTTRTIFIGLQFIDGKLFDVIGSLYNDTNDPEQGHYISMIENQKPIEAEIPCEILHLVSGNNEKSQQTSNNATFSETVHSEEPLARGGHAELEYFSPEIIAEMEEIEKDMIHLTTTDKAYHIREEIPLMQDELETTSTNEECLKNFDFAENKLEFVVEQNEVNSIKELTESSVSECNPKNANQKISKEIEPEAKFVSCNVNKSSEQCLMDVKSVQDVEKPKNINEIQNEKPIENEKSHEHEYYEEQQEKATDAEIEGNTKAPNKSLEMILDERKEEIFDVNTSIDENKIVSEKGKKSDFASNISDHKKHEMANQQSDKNTAVNKATTAIKAKSPGSSESLKKDVKKNSLRTISNIKQSPQNVSKNIGKNISNVMLPKSSIKTIKKTLPTTTTAKMVPPTLKDSKKGNHMINDKKLITQSAATATLPLISTKTATLMERNVKEAGLKYRKNIANSSNVKVTKRNVTPIVTSKLTQSAKSQSNKDDKINAKNRSKDIINENQKITKELENGKKELIGKIKKIGIIDFEPLIWTEILVPTYEEIWRNYESTDQMIDKTGLESEKVIEKKIENLETNNLESIWEMRKNSEFTNVEVIKSIDLLNRDEISVSECFISSNDKKEEFIPDDLSDSLRTKKEGEGNEKVAVEEEILVEDDNGKREIEICGSISIKPSETTEMSLNVRSQIFFQQKISDTILGESIGGDGNSHENRRDEIVEGFEPNLPETQHEAETITNNETVKMIISDDSDKIDGINDINGNEKEMILSEEEVKAERSDSGKELGKTEEKTTVSERLGSKEQMQPKLETNDDRKNGEKFCSKQYHRRNQFGGMYSDAPKEHRHNVTGKNISHKHLEIDGEQNHPQQQYHEISNNDELQCNSQQQSNGNQNHSQKQQQQQSDDISSRYNRNYSGQQGYKKRNKRSKKSRNW